MAGWATGCAYATGRPREHHLCWRLARRRTDEQAYGVLDTDEPYPAHRSQCARGGGGVPAEREWKIRPDRDQSLNQQPIDRAALCHEGPAVERRSSSFPTDLACARSRSAGIGRRPRALTLRKADGWAPYLARFSRDVGYRGAFPLTLDASDVLSGQPLWYPISREKRARYGAHPS